MASPIRILGTALRWLAPVLVVALGAIIARGLILGRKDPPKVERPPRVLPVDVVTVGARDHAATLKAFGTVRPLRTLVVRPTVGGPISETNPQLVEGGLIRASDPLVVIDPRDYELAVATADAGLVAAQSELDIELGAAAVAQREWEFLEGTVEVTDAGKRLALREPYVARRRADLSSARALLDQAKINLERTRITAPFDALVLSEDVEVGTQAVAGSELARLVDRTLFVVEVSVPADRLSGLELDGAPARVLFAGGAREARVERLLGEVDPAGRMARVQVAIPDPLSLGSGTNGDARPPILLGSYVEVELPLLPIEDALSVPRAGLREGDVVLVVDAEDRLQIREVHVALRRDDDVLVTSGLEDGARVIVSPLAVPLPGTQLAPTELGGAAKPAAAPAETAEDAR